MKKAYLLFADGFETIEALAPVDVLTRGGVDIKTVSISNRKEVTSSHHVTVMADLLLSEANLSDGDVIILHGGYPGYVNLRDSEAVGHIIKEYEQSGKYVAAICGAPTVLAHNKIGCGKKVTSHHSVKDEMVAAGYNYTGKNVEIDGKLITAIGAGHAVDFGLALLKLLADEESVAKVKRGMELE